MYALGGRPCAVSTKSRLLPWPACFQHDFGIRKMFVFRNKDEEYEEKIHRCKKQTESELKRMQEEAESGAGRHARRKLRQAVLASGDFRRRKHGKEKPRSAGTEAVREVPETERRPAGSEAMRGRLREIGSWASRSAANPYISEI